MQKENTTKNQEQLADLIEGWHTIRLPAEARRGDEFFLCRICYPTVGIGEHKDDFALVFVTNDIRNGDYVCVRVNNETLVRQVRLTKRHTYLTSTLRTERFTRRQVSIIGRVSTLMRNGECIKPTVPLRSIHDTPPGIRSCPSSPPVRPMTSGKKLNLRARNKVLADESLRLFAIDLDFIKRERPVALWHLMEKALDLCDLHTQASAQFPGLDIYSPQAVYYFSYCIQTRDHSEDLNPTSAFVVARRVFHSILMEDEKGEARVQRTLDAYSEMYGFVQGPRTIFNSRPEEEPEADQNVIDIRKGS